MPNETHYNKIHQQRIDKLVEQVYQLYLQAIQEAVRLGLAVESDSEKPFSFSDYPGLQTKVNKLLSNHATKTITLFNTATASAWLLADQKNDDLVKSLFGDSPPQAISERFLGRNLQALEAFQKRKVAGMGLSQRIWNLNEGFRSELEMGIDIGLLDGRSAAELSRDIRKYLNEPERLFRRVRDERGLLHLSKAAANYHPGQGTYRSSFKNAIRLARTEVNMAYKESDHDRWNGLDFVVGVRIRRSNNPYSCPVCDKLQGDYPKSFKFVGWHPQCRCVSTSILISDKEQERMTQMILDGDDLAGFKSLNEVKQVPAGFTEWVSGNTERILRAKNPPYFIRDNFKGGTVSGGLHLSGLTAAVPKISTVPASTSRKLDLKKFIKGDIPSNSEVKNIMAEYATMFPENFRNGFNNLSFRKSGSYMMQHSMSYNQRTKHWVGGSDFAISTTSFKIKGEIFNPGEELKAALGAIKSGKTLSFHQEYAVESLWHEILHAKTKSAPQKLDGYYTEKMETANQFIARHTYPSFLESLGGKAIHQKQVLDNGLGYHKWVDKFRNDLKLKGISEKEAIAILEPILMRNYGQVAGELAKMLQP